MSCPDNAQHQLKQLGDGIPQNVVSWDSASTEVVIYRCQCGAFKSPHAHCKRCEHLRTVLQATGLDESAARRLVDAAAEADRQTAQALIAQALQERGTSAQIIAQTTTAVAHYKDHSQRPGSWATPAPPSEGGAGLADAPLTADQDDDEESTYQKAKKRFLALAGERALDDADNLAPGYEGLEGLPFYQVFAQARAAYRQAAGVHDEGVLAEGEMRDGKYIVPQRLRTSIKAIGLPKEQTNILAQRFTTIGKESATRQARRMHTRVSAILEAEGITDPDKVQHIVDVMNGRGGTKASKDRSPSPRAGGKAAPRQLTEATRQKLREAAARRVRCKRCGAFMGTSECTRCLRLRQALEDIGVSAERLDTVRDQIAGETREIEREYRQRNRVLMTQEAKYYLAEVSRGDLAMPVMQAIHQQLGEAPEQPVIAHQVTPDEWVIQGARPFMNRDIFPDLSRYGFEWAVDWDTTDPEKAAHKQHELEVWAALALGKPVAPEVLAVYPTLAAMTTGYDANDPKTNSQIANALAAINSGEGGVAALQKYRLVIEVLQRATPPPDTVEGLPVPDTTAVMPPPESLQNLQNRSLLPEDEKNQQQPITTGTSHVHDSTGDKTEYEPTDQPTTTGPHIGREGTVPQPANGSDAGAGESTLEDDAPTDVPGAGTDGHVGGDGSVGDSPDGGVRPDDGLHRPSDAVGGLGDHSRGMGVPAQRRRPARTGPPASPVDEADARPRGRDYRIKPEDGIGEGGLKTKAKQNIAAVRLLKQLEAEDRPATPEEQRVLAKYVGWGGLPQCFDEWQSSPYNRNAEWAEEYKALQALLTDAEYKSAKASTPNAHYTSPTVINAMWQALREMGYDGGNVLEPAAGVGHFLGTMPDEIHANSKRFAVELDSLSARITQKLYPEADVRESGYEKSNLPENYFDMVVSNVPFGDYGVHDPAFVNDEEPLTRRIHNYYFAKAMKQTKPGGVVAFVTNRYTLDSTKHQHVREWLATQADFVGAIRLPNTAFKQNAHTEVTTDIIFLRKRAPGEPPTDTAWVNTVAQDIPNKYGDMTTIQVNEYFAAHPDMMLGTMQATGSMYRDAQPQLVPDERPLATALQEAVARLPKNIANRTLTRCHCGAFVGEDGVCRNPRCSTTINVYRTPTPRMMVAWQHGEYVLDDRRVLCRYDKHGRTLTPVDYDLKKDGKAPPHIDRAIEVIPVKEAAKKLLDLNVAHSDDDTLTQAQAALNQAYDAFVARHGPLHKRANLQAIKDDPQLPYLLSLEHYDPDTDTAVKADIFNKRIVNLSERPESADNAEDALLISVYEGGVHWQRMTELTGLPIPELQEELENAGYVFAAPDGRWHLAEEYLSGDVRKKLQEAQAAASVDSRFQRNVDALLAIQPATLQPSDIKLNMGAGWLPPQDVQDFVRHLIGINIPVHYVAETATWYLDTSDRWTKDRLRYRTENINTWGVPGKTALDLMDDTLNQKDATITKQLSDGKGGTKRETDQQATLDARNMQDKIRAEFEKWVWGDPDRSRRLAGIYNERFNRIVPRQYHHPFRDDDNFIFPGQNPGAFRLRDYQKDAVWRILQGDTTYLAHIVGAGKSATMITASMELKRMGLRNKVMHVMPKHTLEQYADDYKRLYPGAKVLVVGSEDVSPTKRAETLARIATEAWDAVLCSQPTFDKIGVSPELEVSFIEQQIRQYEQGILALHEDGQAYGENRKPSNSVKDLEKRKKRLEEKLQKKIAQLNKDDAGLSFEKLGIDHLFVDEAHYAKKLEFATRRTRVAGLDSSGSSRAFNLYMATRYLQNRCKCGRFVSESGFCAHCAHKTELVPGSAVFASGTPITNTLAEIYSLQRMLNEDELNALGYRSFDAWATQFTEMVTELEMKPSGGGYRSATRMSQFSNVPELLRQLNQYVDWQMDREQMGLKVPLLAGGDQAAQMLYEDERSRLLQLAGTPEALTAHDTLAKGHAHLLASKAWLDFEKARDVYRKPLAVSVPMSGRQRKFIEECEFRADHLPDDPRDDNMLKIVTDARKASLDYRLIDPDAPDDPGSKVNKAVENMMDIYVAHPGKTQMVFLDAGVPKNVPSPRQKLIHVIQESIQSNHQPLGNLDTEAIAQEAITTLNTQLVSAQGWSRKGAAMPPQIQGEVMNKLVGMGIPPAKAAHIAGDIFKGLIEYKNAPRHFNLYEDMKQKLVAVGVPEQEIAFIHDARTDAQKLELFQKMNSGKVRFLFGSTAKMGTGVNAQKKLVALHHIDAPWRPDEVEQREGRILRHGNDNAEIHIYRYATEESFDVYMWQTLERKARFIEQIRNGNMENRHMDDAASAIKLGYAEMKAIATGDPAVLELVGVAHELDKFQALERAYNDKIQGLRWKVAELPQSITRTEEQIARYEAARAAVQKPADGKFAIAIGGLTYSGDGATLESGQALQGLIEAAKADPKNKKAATLTLPDVGKLYGLPLTIHGTYNKTLDTWAIHAVMEAGGSSLSVALGGNAQGDMMKIRNRVDSIDKSLASAKAALADDRERLPTLQAALNQPFEHKTKLFALRQKKADLEARVGKLKSQEKKQVFDDTLDVQDDTLVDDVVWEEAEAAFGY